MPSSTTSGSTSGQGSGKENNGARENGHQGPSVKDNVFDIDSVAFSSDDFRMNEFKVKRCPRARPHDWTQCPFAHPGEKARRRDPRRYKYSGTACPEFRKSGCCRRGDACPFAHGVFECWLHPSRYRTQLCTDGTDCKRRVCFFAHVEEELRHPDDDPGVAQKQVQAELAEGVQTLQHQHLTQALQALLLRTTTNPLTLPPERHPTQLPLSMPDILKLGPETFSTGVVPDLRVEAENSTTALQLALMQQLAAKEQQLQQTVTSHGLGDLSTASSIGEPAMNMTPNYALHQNPDTYDVMSQFKQLSLATTVPVSTTMSPAVPFFDTTSFLSKMLPNGGSANVSTAGLNTQNPVVLQRLIAQATAKDAVATSGHTSHTVDNRYLSSLIPESAGGQTYGSMGLSSSTLTNGCYDAASGTNDISREPAAGAHPPLTAANGIYPGVSSPPQTQYSIENIQLLMQDPSFSSNLSQLLQMNPALQQQLAPNISASAGNSNGRSIGTAPLVSRSNGEMNRFGNNGGIPTAKSSKNGGSIQTKLDSMTLNGKTTASPDDGDGKRFNGAPVSEGFLRELNALKLGLSNGIGMYGTLAGVMQDRYNYPPHSSSIDSEGLTTGGRATSSQTLLIDY